MDVPEPDQLELVQLQHRSRNTALVFTAHPKLHEFPWSILSSIHNMYAFKELQRQPFHRAKRKLHPVLTTVITMLQYRDGSQVDNHSPMSQSLAKLWEHEHTLTTHPETREGLDMQEASGLRRTTPRTYSYPLGMRRCV